MLTLRPFSHKDVPLKVKWINDPANNQYLHYSFPLEKNATHLWLDRVQKMGTRCDLTIISDNNPIGIIGLLNIDKKNRKSAELYITIGEHAYRGKHLAREAMQILCKKAFTEFMLDEIYLFTETKNCAAIHSFENFGMTQVELRKNDAVNQHGVLVDRYMYRITKREFEAKYGNFTANTNL